MVWKLNAEALLAPVFLSRPSYLPMAAIPAPVTRGFLGRVGLTLSGSLSECATDSQVVLKFGADGVVLAADLKVDRPPWSQH